jgi:hypothetical protein
MWARGERKGPEIEPEELHYIELVKLWSREERAQWVSAN